MTTSPAGAPVRPAVSSRRRQPPAGRTDLPRRRDEGEATQARPMPLPAPVIQATLPSVAFACAPPLLCLGPNTFGDRWADVKVDRRAGAPARAAMTPVPGLPEALPDNSASFCHWDD